MIPIQPFSTKLGSEDRLRQKELAQIWDCTEGEANRRSIAIVHQIIHDRNSNEYSRMIEIARRTLRDKEQATSSSSSEDKNIISKDVEKIRMEQQSIIVVINSLARIEQNKSEGQSSLIQTLNSAYNKGKISKDELVQKLIQLLEAAWLQEMFIVMNDLCSRHPGRYRYDNRDELWKDAQKGYLARNAEILTSHLDVRNHRAAITRMVQAHMDNRADAKLNHVSTHHHAKNRKNTSSDQKGRTQSF